MANRHPDRPIYMDNSGFANSTTMIGAADIVNLFLTQTDRVVPREIPPPGAFVNRKDELDRLSRVIKTEPLVLLDGAEGVGKTQLVSQWATGLTQRFPDGFVYNDLTKTHQDGRVNIDRALGRMLTSLGVSVETLPSSLDECHRLWLSITAELKLLVVIDNIDQPALLRHLIPSSYAGTRTVLISRFNAPRFITKGAVPISVTPFSVEHSRMLITRISGRNQWDPDGDELVAACGGRPRTLSRVAECFAVKPELTVANVLREITRHAESRRAHAVERLAAKVQLESMTLPARHLYELLVAMPGDFCLNLASHVAGGDATELLDRLSAAQLICPSGNDQWRVNRSTPEHEPDPDALARIVDWYRRVARAAEGAVVADRQRVIDIDTDKPQWAPRLTRKLALDWLDSEIGNIVTLQRFAFDHGWYESVVSLEQSLWILYLHRPHPDHRESTSDLAIQAAVRLQDSRLESRMRGQRSRHLLNIGDPEAASGQADRARRLAKAAGDRRLEGSAYEMIARILLEQRRYAEAVELYDEARLGHLDAGDHRGAALMRHHRARALARAGRPEKALTELSLTRNTYASLRSERDEANILLDLGIVHEQLGEIDQAIEALNAANTKFQDENQYVRMLRSFELLGDCHQTQGDHDAAVSAWQSAVEAHARLGILTGGDLERLRAKLAAHIESADT